MDYDWSPNNYKRMANPAWKFFDRPVIAGDNIEIGPIYSQSRDPISLYIGFLLSHKNEIDNVYWVYGNIKPNRIWCGVKLEEITY